MLKYLIGKLSVTPKKEHLNVAIKFKRKRIVKYLRSYLNVKQPISKQIPKQLQKQLPESKIQANNVICILLFIFASVILIKKSN